MWEKINNQERLQNFQKSLQRDIDFGDTNDAKQLYYFLKDILQQENIDIHASEVAKEYYDLMYKAGFFAISLLRNEDVVYLFKVALPNLLKTADFDFLEELKKFFIFSVENKIIADRVAFKQKLIEIMEKNELRLDNKDGKLIGKKLLPDISSWLKDYRAFSNKEVPDKVTLNEYLSNAQAVKGATKEERDQIALLLKIYDYLRLTTIKPFLFEEDFFVADETGDYILTEGRAEKIDPKIKEQTNKIKQVLDLHYSQEDVRNAYEKQNKDLTESIAGQKEEAQIKNREELLKMIKNNELNKEKQRAVISFLEDLAGRGKIMDFLSEPKTATELPRFFQQSEILNEAQKNAKIPESLTFLSAFLRYVLEEKLSLKENEATVEAIKIANIIKRKTGKDYLALAYYDLSKNKFTWS